MRLTKPDRRAKPRAHRFAVIPPNGFQGKCNPLKVGEFYTHVYQTKVQVRREMRTLHSKRMTKELKILCGNAYHPRKYDLEDFKPPVESSNRGAPMGRYKTIPQPPQIFQPLSQIQGIPPYIHNINPTNNPPYLYNKLNQQPKIITRSTNQQANNEGVNPNNNTTDMNASSGYHQTVFNQSAIQPQQTYFWPPQQFSLQNQGRFFR